MWTALSADVSTQDEKYNARVFIPQTAKGHNDEWLAYVSETQSQTGSLKVFRPTDVTRTRVREAVMCSPTPLTDSFVITCPTLGKKFKGDLDVRVNPKPISILKNITTSMDSREQVKLVALPSKLALDTENLCGSIQGSSDWFIHRIPGGDDLVSEAENDSRSEGQVGTNSRAKAWFRSKLGS